MPRLHNPLLKIYIATDVWVYILLVYPLSCWTETCLPWLYIVCHGCAQQSSEMHSTKKRNCCCYVRDSVRACACLRTFLQYRRRRKEEEEESVFHHVTKCLISFFSLFSLFFFFLFCFVCFCLFVSCCCCLCVFVCFFLFWGFWGGYKGGGGGGRGG